MPVPTLDKIWQFSLNNRVFAANTNRTGGGDDFADDQRALFYGIKEALKAFVSGDWVVEGSSDSSNSNMTGTDEIGAPTQAEMRNGQKGSSNPHSWLVMSNANLGGNGLHVLWNHEGYNNNNGAAFDVYISEVGFGTANGGTDGSNTVRPTATDEELILDGNTVGIGGMWGSGSDTPSARDYVFHAMMSDDGECTRVFIYHNNSPLGCWIMDTVKNPVTGYTEAHVVAFSQISDSNSARTPVYAMYNEGTARVHGIRTGIGMVDIHLTTELFNNNPIGQQSNLTRTPNQVNSEFIASAIGVASETSGFIGRHGQLFDIWWGPEEMKEGSMYPGDDTRQLVQFGDLIVPWDGSTLPLTA